MNDSATQYIGGFIALYLSCSLASSAGLGGGGLNVPLLLVIIGFPYKTCVVLSLCAVLGNHCSQTTINWFKSHPFDVSRPLIYWDVVLIFLPATLGGTTLGVVIAPTLPETLLLTFSMFVISFALFKASSKGIKTYRKETELINMNLISESLLHQNYDVKSSEVINQYIVVNGNGSSSYSKLNQSFFYPQPNYIILMALFAVWSAFAIIYVTLQVATSPCSTAYYSLLGATYIPLVITILWAVKYVTKTQLDGSNVLTGLGTAEMMGPLLLSLKVIPMVSSATTSAMSLLYTSSTLLHYGILGKID
eukprot:gene18230-23900_t